MVYKQDFLPKAIIINYKYKIINENTDENTSHGNRYIVCQSQRRQGHLLSVGRCWGRWLRLPWKLRNMWLWRLARYGWLVHHLCRRCWYRTPPIMGRRNWYLRGPRTRQLPRYFRWDPNWRLHMPSHLWNRLWILLLTPRRRNRWVLQWDCISLNRVVPLPWLYWWPYALPNVGRWKRRLPWNIAMHGRINLWN